jgi:hypothetical protein
MKFNRNIGLRRFIALCMLFMLATLTLVIAVATPEGPSTLSVTYRGRRLAFPAPTLNASAGNITHLVVNGKTVTQTWQGFVGNITGTITLDDSLNYTLYNWSLADPEGEIYATTLDSVDWTTGSVNCWNYSNNADNHLYLGELEGWSRTTVIPSEAQAWINLTVKTDDVDGVNETFKCEACYGGNPAVAISGANETAAFFVGGQKIDGVSRNMTGNCPNTKLYNTSGGPAFQEVLLYVDTTGTDDDGVVYTSILNQSVASYNGAPADFEMIVGENGHLGNTADTVYYFYVELE